MQAVAETSAPTAPARSEWLRVLPFGMAANLQITISRWSTDEERSALLTALENDGQEALHSALREQEPTGFVRARLRGKGSVPSRRLRYAHQYPLEGGGRRVVLALERPITFYETPNVPRRRAKDDVTLIVMDLDEGGNGTGQLAIGARVAVDGDRKLVVEKFGNSPVRLKNISRSD